MMERYLASLGSSSSAIFAVAGFLATAFLLGWALLGRSRTWHRHTLFFLSLTLGIDLVVLIALPFLWLGILPDWLLKTVFAGGLIGVALLITIRRRSWANMPPGVPWHLMPFLLLGLLLFKNALGYPFQYDDLTYQIAVPQRWLKANSLEVFRDNPFSGFPGVNLIGNLLLLKAGGLLAPLLFNYTLGLVLALASYFLVREHTGPWTATIFSLSFVLSEPYLMVVTSAFAEPWILLQFTALLFLVRRPAEQRWEWVLLGIFAGFAGSIKLTGLIIMVAAGLFVIWTMLRPVAGTASCGARLLAHKHYLPYFLGPMLFVMICFYARPFLATGDPLYPYFAWWFTDDTSTIAMSTYHHDAGKQRFGSGMNGSWEVGLYYCETPFLLCLDPIVKSQKSYYGTFGLQGLVHLLLVGVMILGAFRNTAPRQPGKEQDSSGFLFLAGALLLYTFWFFTAQQARFLLPAYLCLVLAASCNRRMLAPTSGKCLLAALVLLTLWSVPDQVRKHIGNSWTARPIDMVYSATDDEYLALAVRLPLTRPRTQKFCCFMKIEDCTFPAIT